MDFYHIKSNMILIIVLVSLTEFFRVFFESKVFKKKSWNWFIWFNEIFGPGLHELVHPLKMYFSNYVVCSNTYYDMVCCFSYGNSVKPHKFSLEFERVCGFTEWLFCKTTYLLTWICKGIWYYILTRVCGFTGYMILMPLA